MSLYEKLKISVRQNEPKNFNNSDEKYFHDKRTK